MIDREIFLDAALTIGLRLCDEAMWDDRACACTWQGSEIKDPWISSQDTVVRSIDGSLYCGTAGIALFLSQLYRAVPDERLKFTALGALRNAVTFAQVKVGPDIASPFVGALGVVFVFHEAGNNLNETALHSKAMEILHSVLASIATPTSHHLLDLLSGTAGSIVALLALQRKMRTPELFNHALALGLDLCARADWNEDFCTWDAREASGIDTAGPLAGFSHGASGQALALLRLFEVTGHKEFLITARGAYAYENTLFASQSSNWLDLRYFKAASEAIAHDHWPTAWCHGAAGIALSRSEAVRIDTEWAEEHFAVLKVAAQTTSTALAKNINNPASDATLCHGVSGLFEILNILDGSLPAMGLVQDAIVAASTLIGLHGAAQDWPSGVPGGEQNPSLLIGDAGIGHAFLRLVYPEVISPVLLMR